MKEFDLVCRVDPKELEKRNATLVMQALNTRPLAVISKSKIKPKRVPKANPAKSSQPSPNKMPKAGPVTRKDQPVPPAGATRLESPKYTGESARKGI